MANLREADSDEEPLRIWAYYQWAIAPGKITICGAAGMPDLLSETVLVQALTVVVCAIIWILLVFVRQYDRAAFWIVGLTLLLLATLALLRLRKKI